MKTPTHPIPVLVALSLLAAAGCTEPKGSGSTASGPTDPTAAESSSGGVDSAESSEVGPGEESGTTQDAEPTTNDGSFIPDPDVPGEPMCDVWAQDCGKGEKCMPYANNGGGAWNATRCSPLDPGAASVGDPCTVDGTGVSGADDCERDAMCWNVDPETGTGTCVAFCEGSEANPVCTDPETTCNILNDGVLILCLPNCDPLLGDCNEGENCYPTAGVFSCVPDASDRGGAYGDPCQFLNVCDAGLFCSLPAGVPGCTGAEGCCTPYCDVSEPDASASCPGAAGGQECVPWYDEAQPPPGYEDVGACAIPV